MGDSVGTRRTFPLAGHRRAQVGRERPRHHQPPPLTVSGPDARRVCVELAGSDHTVGELADALGVPRRAGVLVDGRPVDRRVRLDRAGIVHGSRIVGRPERMACCTERTGTSHVAAPGERRFTVTVEAGPAAGTTFSLPPGRHIVGRSPRCAVRLDDDLVELHHAIVDVADAAEVGFTQLSGRVPCRADTDGTAPASCSPPPQTLPAGSVITIGASRLRLGSVGAQPARPAALARRRGDPWRLSLHRPPRPPTGWAPTPVAPPSAELAQSRHTSGGGLLAALLSVAGGVTLAIVIGHPIYLILSCVGLITAIGSALSRRVRWRRLRRHSAADTRRDLERFAADLAAQRSACADHQRRSVPSLAAILQCAGSLTDELWARRADHPDAFAVALGWGEVAWDARVDCTDGELVTGGAGGRRSASTARRRSADG